MHINGKSQRTTNIKPHTRTYMNTTRNITSTINITGADNRNMKSNLPNNRNHTSYMNSNFTHTRNINNAIKRTRKSTREPTRGSINNAARVVAMLIRIKITILVIRCINSMEHCNVYM